MTAVVVTPVDAPQALASAFLPPTRSVVGVGFLYHLYRIDQPIRPARYTDIDGSLLVAIHVFATDAAAERWIRKDDRRHRGRRQVL